MLSLIRVSRNIYFNNFYCFCSFIDQKKTLDSLTLNANSLVNRLSNVIKRLQLQTKQTDFLQDKIDQLDHIQSIVSQCDLINEIITDEETAKENKDFITNELSSVENALDSLDIDIYLDTEEEQGDALLYLTAGAGGDDSNDWTLMLKEMYEKWAIHKCHNVNEIEVSEATHGIRNACIQICGENVYGLLKNETGVHRLIRISPFNAQGKRQTSFASVTVVPSINDDITVQIRPSDIRIETKRASGPGGQHVNTTDSAVRITHIPTGITASASTKSQASNKRLALSVLKSRIYEREKQLRGTDSIELKSTIDQQSWGAQIRNYVLHPYQNVIDLRTRVTCPQPNLVLNGTKLDEFLLPLVKLE